MAGIWIAAIITSALALGVIGGWLWKTALRGIKAKPRGSRFIACRVW